MTSSKTIAEVAGEAVAQFETRERYAGEPGRDTEDYVTLKDDAPEWLHDLVRDAHGEFLPDDWRYRSIRSALGGIHDDEPEDLDDYAGEWADGNVDTYTSDRLAWLASNLSRPGYCDEAMSEGLFEPSEDNGIVAFIGAGQYMESREVFESVRRSLDARMAEIAA